MPGYFEQTQFVSNSDLKELKRLLKLQEQKDLTQIFNFGNLVDSMLTEESTVSEFAARSTEAEQQQARLMVQAGKADATLALFLETCKTQHEIYRNGFPILWDGMEIKMPMRMKLDLCNKPLRTGGDIKTTACTSQKAFVESIEFFDYDQQGALYMDGAGLDRFMFVGLSKKPNRRTGKHEVYKYAMQRGDEAYEQGKRKYSYLAFHYYFLIYNLSL